MNTSKGQEKHFSVLFRPAHALGAVSSPIIPDVYNVVIVIVVNVAADLVCLPRAYKYTPHNDVVHRSAATARYRSRGTKQTSPRSL